MTGATDRPFLPDDIRSSFHQISPGTSPGANQWRREHFFSLEKGPRSPEFNNLLVHYVTNLHDDPSFVPTEARHFVFGGVLFPLQKPDNRGLRPIVVGDIFVKTLGKAIAKHLAPAFLDFFAPRGQLGVSTPNGTDTVLHSIRVALASHPEWAVFQVDFRNAFNVVSRELISNQVLAHFPKLHRYFLLRYGSSTSLVVPSSHRHITSSTGVQQGDPLGPLFFSLALQAILDRAITPNGTLRLAIADDVTLCGPPQDVASAVASIRNAANDLASGLAFATHKCVAWSPSRSAAQTKAALGVPENADAPDMRMSEDELESFSYPERDQGITLLGIPIGSPSFIQNRLGALLVDRQRGLDRLHSLSSLQCQFILLRYSFVPSTLHTLRTIRPVHSLPFAAECDKQVERALRNIQGFGCSSESPWATLVHLPLRCGGMGLTSARLTAHAAFLSSVSDSLRLIIPHPSIAQPIAEDLEQLVHSRFLGPLPSALPVLPAPWEGVNDLADIIDTFKDSVANFRGTRAAVNSCPINFSILDDHANYPASAPDVITVKPKLQQRLSKLQAEMSFSKLMLLIHPASQTRLLSQRHRGALALYDSIPSCDELAVPNDVFRYMAWHTQFFSDIPSGGASGLGQRFGPVFRCACQTIEASQGLANSLLQNHEDHCSHLNAGLFTLRHDIVCNTIARCLQNAKGAIIIPCYQQRMANENSISTSDVPDIDIINFPRIGQKSFVEIGIVSPFQQRFHVTSRSQSLVAGKTRQREKEIRYNAHANSHERHLFVPVIETTGAFSPAVDVLLSACAANLDHAAFECDADKRTWLSDSFKRFWTQAISASFWGASYECGRRLLEQGGSLSLSVPANCFGNINGAAQRGVGGDAPAPLQAAIFGALEEPVSSLAFRASLDLDPDEVRLSEDPVSPRLGAPSHGHGLGAAGPPAPPAGLGVFRVASLLSSQDQLSSGESLLSTSPPFPPADINGQEVQVEFPASHRAGGELALGPRPLRP